jgi:hypothetical protein
MCQYTTQSDKDEEVNYNKEYVYNYLIKCKIILNDYK